MYIIRDKKTGKDNDREGLKGKRNFNCRMT